MSQNLGRMQKRQQMLKQVQHDKCRFCSRETMILVTHFMKNKKTPHFGQGVSAL
jgi:hypothetical protein